MAKCIIVSGTRVCDDGLSYRVNGGKTLKPYPRLTKAELAAVRPIRTAIREFGVDPAQARLATALMQAVLAVPWDATRTANVNDIEQSVKLMLVRDVGKMDGLFTLIAY